MPNPQPSADDVLLSVALAIADGHPVDWPSLGGSARTDVHNSSSGSSGLLRVDQIVRGHREVLARGPVEAPKSLETLLTATARNHSGISGAIQVVWGPLVVLEKIGRGTFGDVYRARDPRLDRDVALKLLRKDVPDQIGSPAVEEGRLLARVRHPNVVTVFGADRASGRVGIWMELVRGHTLADEIRKQGPLSPRAAAAAVAQVCRALEAVHAANLLHRDVKAQNVMRDETGRIVLGDFGTGLLVDEHLESASALAGTPLYLAPEVLEHRTASVASDVYSVGVLLYFLLSGRHPVEGKTLDDVRNRHATGASVRLRSLVADIPKPLETIVEKLLAAAPDQRFGSALEVERALDGWLAGQPEQTQMAWRSRSWLAAATVALAIATAGAYVTWKAGAAPPAGAPIVPAGAPVSRLLVNPACSAVPAQDGTIACVETQRHNADRGGKPPLPLVRYRPFTGETQVLRQPGDGQAILSALIAPDATQVIYTLQRRDAPLEIRLLTIPTAEDRLVTPLPSEMTALALLRWSELEPRIDVRLWLKDGGHLLGTLTPETGAIEAVYRFPVVPQGVARSPDGRLIAYDARASDARPERDIKVCALDNGQCVTVAAHPANDGRPFWSPDGRLYFVSDRSGLMGLWSVALEGLELRESARQLLDTGRSHPMPLGFSSDGTLFYNLVVDQFDVYTADLAEAPVVPVRPSPRAVDVNKEPEWSPDGRQLAYVSQRGLFAEAGAVRIVVQELATRREREFPLDIRPNMTRLSWSPDGRRLALRTLLGPTPPHWQFGVHLMSLETGQIEKTLQRTHPAERFVEDQIGDIAWLDADTVLFSSSGGVRVFDVNSGTEKVIWSPPAGQVVGGLSLSQDRSAIAVWVIESPEAPAISIYRVVVMSANGDAVREILKEGPGTGLTLGAWSADGASLLISRFNAIAMRNRTFQLWRLPLDGSPPTAFPLAHAQLADFSTHPDGRRIAFMMGAPDTQFWVMSGIEAR